MIPLVRRFLLEPAFFLSVLAAVVSFLATDTIAMPHSVKVIAVVLAPLLAGAGTRQLVVPVPKHAASVKAAQARKKLP